jgi:hypothetical protein
LPEFVELEVTVCVAIPLFVQQTVVPTGTVTDEGENYKSTIEIVVEPVGHVVVAAGADRGPPGNPSRIPPATSASSA